MWLAPRASSPSAWRQSYTFVRQEAALAFIEQQIAAGRAAQPSDSCAMNRSIGGSANFIESEVTIRPPVAVLAAATRILPDDTLLTRWSCGNGK